MRFLQEHLYTKTQEVSTVEEDAIVSDKAGDANCAILIYDALKSILLDWIL